MNIGLFQVTRDTPPPSLFIRDGLIKKNVVLKKAAYAEAQRFDSFKRRGPNQE